MRKNDQGEPVESPIVQALSNLCSANFGILYVVYAPLGQRKSFGARTFIKNCCQFDDTKV
jgi:hypothetical protein